MTPATTASAPIDASPKLHGQEILLVDDAPNNLDVLTALLSEAHYTVRATTLPQMALQSALSKPPDLIVLDVRMPEMDGFTLCQKLKADPRTAAVPVIFVSAVNEVADRVRGLEVGGVDFVGKPFQREEILARVHTHLALRAATVALEQQKRSLAQQVQQRTRELEQQRNAAQNYLDMAGVMLVALDAQGCIHMLNQRGAELLGASERELLGRNLVQEFVLGRDRELLLQALGAHPAPAHPLDIHLEGAHGGQRVLSWHCRHLPAQSSALPTGPALILCSGEDVTERRHMESALRASEEKYRGYVENVPGGIFVVNTQGVCLEVNPAACQLVGQSSAELAGKSLFRLICPDDLPSFKNLFHAIRWYQSFGTELRLQSASGAQVRVGLKAVDLGEYGILVFCSDVTELRRVQTHALARAEELNAAVQQLERLSAHMRDSIEQERMTIASDIHDQIGASLTGARLLLGQLGSDLAPQAQAQVAQVQDLLAQGLSATRGVYTRLRPPMLDDLGLVETCHWYLREWEHSGQLKVTSQLDALEPEPGEHVRLDVFRILQELLTNVARHAHATQVHVRLGQSSQGLTLSVTDNGAGFDLGAQATGFGLLGIRGRLNRHQGRIWTERSEGAMRVFVYLPRTEPRAD